ncbi:MAG TPA: BTAD domain-containing putative transcriptional regulator [Gaiellaceae bacterium]|nr:BTAD domain-containing putative transcriptional regulator [Gaiellaceae bacterium]
MDFRILGPLEVRDRGGSVQLRGRKPRALLAVLVLHAGEAVTSDALIDALWGERPPRTARAALQNYVALLRRTLGPGLVESRAGGYVLEAAPDQIDLGRFERLTAEAGAAEPEERVAKLREALALWRGPALADLAFEPFAALEGPRLEELRTTALEDLVDAELAAGAGPALVTELEELIAEHPFRERLRGQLMLALYRSGRQAEALEAYQETRRALVDELGIEPGTALRELEAAILRQDPSLLVDAPVAEPESRPGERRKTVTILLADVTSPGTADPELLHDSSTRALARMRTVLEEHGATIEQRAGDEVLAVFGIPQAHEDDALRAARAALELEVELDGFSDVLEAEGRGRIELRVGIETGEALVGVDETGHGFAAGPAIGDAKRMLQRALANEILAGPATVRLLGEAASLEPAGDGDACASRLLELLEGAPARARHLEAPLVGREAELAALREAFAGACAERRCRVFLVLGEPGIGKSRLAHELAVELEPNATVLFGRCVAYGRGATFLPLAEIVRSVREHHPLGEVLAGDEHADLIGARLAQLTGEDEGPASGGETFWAVRRFFEALAATRPLVLVFEDLHWGEPTLLDLIDYLGDRSTAPILLLGLARPELLEQRPGWNEREAAALRPLAGEESEVLLDSLGPAPEAQRDEILATAGGNPLFLEQLLAHAAESGATETLPPSIDALLASRLDRLETGGLAVLQRAAVAGARFSRDVVVELLREEQPTDVDSHLLAGVRKGLLRVERQRDGAFRFHHVLIRDAAYATLPKTQRAELHERVARWLERGPERADELVGFHLEQAHDFVVELGAGDEHAAQLASEAGFHLSAAGLRAAKSGDMPAASNLLARSRSLLGPATSTRRDLLTELGLVLWRSGDVAGAEREFETAVESAGREGDRRAGLRARTELANLRLRRAQEGVADELFALAAEAIPVFEQDGDDRALGRIWFALATTYGGLFCRYGKASEAAARARAHFRGTDWPLVSCLQELAAALYYGPTPVPEATLGCRELLQEADRSGEAQILAYIAGLEAMGGRFESADELVGRTREIFEDLGWTVNVLITYAPMAANIALLAGRFAEAEELLAESCSQLEPWGLRGQLATQATQLAEAVYGQGRYDEALRWSETAESSAASYDVGAQFLWRGVRGKALAQLGRAGDGERLTREAVALAGETDSVSQHAAVLLCHAEALRLDGRADEAATAAGRAVDLLEAKGNVAAARRAGLEEGA